MLAAVEYVSKHPDYKDSNIGLLSICMGAASSTYAFGKENGLREYENIKAMIAVQPLLYPDFIKALRLDNFIGRRVTKRNNERTGIDLNATSFLPNVTDINVPTLLVQNSNDQYLNRESIEQYFDELQVEKEMMWLDLDKRRAAGYDYLTKNPEQVLTFFDRYC